MIKLNCWEFKKCGREPGGDKVNELGICPVSTEIRLDGTHGGKNAGRACWVVAGSMCEGEIQGPLAHKYGMCIRCNFFSQVVVEEGRLELPSTILSKLRQELTT